MMCHYLFVSRIFNMDIKLSRPNSGKDTLLIVDGEPIGGKNVIYVSWNDEAANVSIFDAGAVRKISKANLCDLPSNIEKLSLSLRHTPDPFIREMEFCKIGSRTLWRVVELADRNLWQR